MNNFSLFLVEFLSRPNPLMSLFYMLGLSMLIYLAIALSLKDPEKIRSLSFKTFMISALVIGSCIFILQEARLDNNSCFMAMSYSPLTSLKNNDETVEYLNKKLANINQGLILAQQYQVINIKDLEKQRKEMEDKLDLYSRHEGKDSEYPKMTEFIIVDQDEKGFTAINDENTMTLNNSLLLYSNFKRHTCSNHMTQLIKKEKTLIGAKDLSNE